MYSFIEEKNEDSPWLESSGVGTLGIFNFETFNDFFFFFSSDPINYINQHATPRVDEPISKIISSKTSNIRRHACAVRCGAVGCGFACQIFLARFSLFPKIERLCHSMSGWNRMNPNHFRGRGCMYVERRHTEYTHKPHTPSIMVIWLHTVHSIPIVCVEASWNRKRHVDISYSNTYMSTHVRLGSRAVIWSVRESSCGLRMQAKDAETMKSSAFFFADLFFVGWIVICFPANGSLCGCCLHLTHSAHQ